MGLHIDVLSPKELLRPIASQIFDHVHMLAPAIIAAARIPLGILIGQHAADGLHYGHAGVIFAGNHFQAILLPLGFGFDGIKNGWILLLKNVHGEADLLLRGNWRTQNACKGLFFFPCQLGDFSPRRS